MEAVTPNGRHNPRDAVYGVEGEQTLLSSYLGEFCFIKGSEDN